MKMLMKNQPVIVCLLTTHKLKVDPSTDELRVVKTTIPINFFTDLEVDHREADR
jgi:hypothetical protein